MLAECSAVYFKKPLRIVINMRRLRGPAAQQAYVYSTLKRVLLVFGFIISCSAFRVRVGDGNSRML